MRYLVLACDYDGTLATHGKIDDATVAALERLAKSGRKLMMVTGRELDELMTVCPHLDLFEWIVAENGALLYRPSTKEEKPLGDAPPQAFIDELEKRGVKPYSIGRVIAATWEPHENTVLEIIRDLGLEMQVIFNKGAVMVLPSGVNKATGLKAALAEMQLSVHNVVAVGDAENDHAFLSVSECGAAVSNALPMLKERADIVTVGDHGAGVSELIDRIVENDLSDMDGVLTRHHLLLGKLEDDKDLCISPYRKNVLICGTSGGGKSTLATGLIERLTEHGYQFCVIDPEGDYSDLPGAVMLGTQQSPPSLDEAAKLFDDPANNGVINLLGSSYQERPGFFLSLISRLQDLRARTGRPHWILVDEAHHVLPSSWEPSALTMPQNVDRMLFVTLEPTLVNISALSQVDTVIAVGEDPEKTLGLFAEAVDEPAPIVGHVELEKGQVMVWDVGSGEAPYRMKVAASKIDRRRHSRKYAEGEIDPDLSFYFRGPENKLKLRAQNLIVFLQLAEGVDDDTWLHHLRAGDYSLWFRDVIKNDGLAENAAAVEADEKLSAADSRKRIKELIEAEYTLPGGPVPGAAPTGVGTK